MFGLLAVILIAVLVFKQRPGSTENESVSLDEKNMAAIEQKLIETLDGVKNVDQMDEATLMANVQSTLASTFGDTAAAAITKFLSSQDMGVIYATIMSMAEYRIESLETLEESTDEVRYYKAVITAGNYNVKTLLLKYGFIKGIDAASGSIDWLSVIGTLVKGETGESIAKDMVTLINNGQVPVVQGTYNVFFTYTEQDGITILRDENGNSEMDNVIYSLYGIEK